MHHIHYFAMIIGGVVAVGGYMKWKREQRRDAARRGWEKRRGG